MSWTFLGSQTLVSTGTSAYTLTLPTSAGDVNMVEASPENGLAYITFDGVAPTSVASITLSTGNGPYRYTHNAIEDAKVVFSTTNTSLRVDYYQ